MAKAIPDGLRALTPAMTIDGAAEAMAFFQRAFGAVEVMRAPDPSGKKIWHAAMQIGDSQFFVNDAFPEMGALANKSRMWIYVDGVDAAWKRATEAGVTTRMPLGDMFWGDRLGTLIDPWGNEWTLAQHMKDLTPAEIAQAEAAFIASQKP